MKQTVKQGISPFYLTIIIKHLHIKANSLTFVCKKSKKKGPIYFLLINLVFFMKIRKFLKLINILLRIIELYLKFRQLD